LIGNVLCAGDATVVIATGPHREGLEERLRARDLDPEALRQQGRYVSLDAGETLSKFMVDEWPDANRFTDVIGGVIGRAAQKSSRGQVRAFGEMVALLFAEGRPEAAIRVEELWNRLAGTAALSLCCAYPLNAFHRDIDGSLFLKVCSEHSRVIPSESYAALPTRDERLRSITQLQQKAKVLEIETARRKEAEKSLRLREMELTDFLESAVEGLHRVGPDGRILWANAAQLHLLGYSAEEYVGHHLAEFYVQRERFHVFWGKLLSREIVYDFPALLRCKDGSVKHVLIHSNGLWENGQFLYTRCFIRDVTERVQLEDELKKRLAQLAEADRRKNEFLAILGHELRNPLSAVVNAIAAADLNESCRERALDIARRQTGQLARLVDDLLDITRITQGRIALRREVVHVRIIVECVVEEARSLLESRRQELVVSFSPETDNVQVDADPARLQQIVDNLIHNATKFTPPAGRVEVLVQLEHKDVVLRVRDSGIGISPEMLPCVFDLFTQADHSLDRAQGGLGIGLTLIKGLVEMHGGRVQARSDGPGKGSEFEVRLPALPKRCQSASATGRVPAASGHAHVLIVNAG
jgi:PAS domain S-box-containing protein